MENSKNLEGQNVILINNMFNGKYLSSDVNIGHEIINLYQSDNGNFYVYINPYGNIQKKWDNKIEHILFIRSVRNRNVKIIGKVEIEKQLLLDTTFSNERKHEEQIEYIKNNDIRYGGILLNEIFDSNEQENPYPYFITFKAAKIYKAKQDIYLSLQKDEYSLSTNTFPLENIKAINNQSQKLYIDSSEPSDKNNYEKLIKEVINNENYWEEVSKVDSNADENKKLKTFLSIIRKENDELVNSNLLAYFLESDKEFWLDFVEKILGISSIQTFPPKITRESFYNIDLFIEVEKHIIVIENKIKSRINGKKEDGYSQLKKYIEKTQEYAKQNDIAEDHLHYYLLRPDYNNEDYTTWDKEKKYTEIKYSDICKIIENPKPDFYFKEFKDVVKKHSNKYDNELFEIMNERFIEKLNQ
jgi:hypothetical protein